jgi:DtxR family Mn-dependent transcriptional regulator
MPMELSASQEDYLETILGLILKTGNARVRDIAGHLRVAKSSVSFALRSLAKHRMVNYEPYQMVSLTDEGRAMAEKILRRHETISSFFTGTLGVEKGVADADACRIEHAIGDGVMQRLACFMEFMSECATPASRLPEAFREHCAGQRRSGECHGCKVAADSEAKGGKDVGAGGLLTLADLKPGETAKVVRVEATAAAARRLLEMGFTRGSPVTVLRVAPMGDPIEVRVRGYSLSLRRTEARKVLVGSS